MNMTDNNDNSDDKPKDQKLLGHQLTDEELEHQKILEYFQRLSDPYSPIDETLPIDQKIEKLFRDLPKSPLVKTLEDEVKENLKTMKDDGTYPHPILSKVSKVTDFEDLTPMELKKYEWERDREDEYNKKQKLKESKLDNLRHKKTMKSLRHLTSKRRNFSSLLNEMIDMSYEGRERDTSQKSMKNRVNDSLMMMDDLESHLLRMSIQKCKTHQSKRIKGKDKFYDGDSTLKDLNYKSDSRFNDNHREKYLKSYTNSKDVCQSLWCLNCRKMVTKIYERNVRNHLSLNGKSLRLYPPNVEYKNEDFHHITGVVGLSDFNFDDVQRMIKKDSTVWRRIRRNVEKIDPKYSPFIETVYELELVNWIHLNNSTESDFKKKQIQQLRQHYKTDNSTFLFVHFHSITNLSKQQIDDVFKDYYFVGDKPLIKHNQTNGLYVQSLRNKQTLDRNIEKMCSYPFKSPIRYKHSFRGSDYKSGELFEFEELSKLMKIYQRFQKRSWRGLFRSVTHPISEDIKKWKGLFPSNHRMWKDFESNVFEDTVGIDPTYLVSPIGDVFVEGWNPNNFFKGKDLKITTKERNRKIIGKKWFDHWEFPWIHIYKNIYEDTYYDGERSITLEEFYHNNKYLKLTKDQFISWNSTMFGDRYFKRIPYITNEEVKRLDFEKDKEIDKTKLINKLNTILSSDIGVQRSYVKLKVLSKTKTSKKKYSKMSDEEVRILLTHYIIEEIDKLNGTHNLEKFMK